MDFEGLLKELKAQTLERDSIKDAASRAVVELADWLAFPTELGKYPDEIDILDTRALYWPPARGTLPLTLLRYRVFDESGLEPPTVGVGLVGSVTFSLFSCENHQRPPEDVYGIHCYWECAQAKLLFESESVSPARVEKALAAASIPLGNAAPIVRVAFATALSPFHRGELEYPGDEVLLLAGEHDGRTGWLICDGPRSTWYPASELPDDAPSRTVAMLHVGRVLLGFRTQDVERRSFKTTRHPLSDVEFSSRYERALALARRASASERAEAFDSFGPLARHASRYVQLLTTADRAGEAKTFIDELAPYWDHNSGYSRLAKLAFQAGLFDTAKHLIEKLRRSYEHHHRSETMALLAQIYAKEGKRPEAIALLRDCIDKIKADEQCSPREVAKSSAPLLAALAELER